MRIRQSTGGDETVSSGATRDTSASAATGCTGRSPWSSSGGGGAGGGLYLKKERARRAAEAAAARRGRRPSPPDPKCLSSLRRRPRPVPRRARRPPPRRHRRRRGRPAEPAGAGEVPGKTGKAGGGRHQDRGEARGGEAREAGQAGEAEKPGPQEDHVAAAPAARAKPPRPSNPPRLSNPPRVTKLGRPKSPQAARPAEGDKSCRRRKARRAAAEAAAPAPVVAPVLKITSSPRAPRCVIDGVQVGKTPFVQQGDRRGRDAHNHGQEGRLRAARADDQRLRLVARARAARSRSRSTSSCARGRARSEAGRVGRKKEAEAPEVEILTPRRNQ